MFSNEEKFLDSVQNGARILFSVTDMETLTEYRFIDGMKEDVRTQWLLIFDSPYLPTKYIEIHIPQAYELLSMFTMVRQNNVKESILFDELGDIYNYNLIIEKEGV